MKHKPGDQAPQEKQQVYRLLIGHHPKRVPRTNTWNHQDQAPPSNQGHHLTAHIAHLHILTVAPQMVNIITSTTPRMGQGLADTADRRQNFLIYDFRR